MKIMSNPIMKKNLTLILLTLAGCAVMAQAPNYSSGKNGIKLTGYDNPQTFLNAKLALDQSMFAGKELLDTGAATFKFQVENYSLGAQTPDAGTLMCANSAKGQHIHFILDNQPYQASYSPEIKTNLKPGHHVLLAFLSRSYHESIKTKYAYILKEFDVAQNGPDKFDSKAPHIFFSRPKGEYVGEKETQKVLLDFYLINCTLSEKGYKVRATIDGSEFILTRWEPYFIEGLPLGEHKIKLELLDKTDKTVQTEFNGTERTIKLSTEPAAK
jgi:hypothetical protein